MLSRMPLLVLSIVSVASLTGCGGDATAEPAAAGSGAGKAATASTAKIDCAPLAVAVDGEPVSGLTHAYAYSEGKAFGVEVFNHGDHTCADILSRSRDVPEGEVAVRAWVDGSGNRASVGVGSKTNFTSGIELVRDSKTEGEQVAICAPKVEWTAGFGGGTKYTVEGLFAAEYCGERGDG